MLTDNEVKDGRYLGDGVYVAYDGYQMWLSVGNHNNQVVALDDEVWVGLIKYRADLAAWIRARNEATKEVPRDDRR